MITYHSRPGDCEPSNIAAAVATALWAVEIL